MLGQENDIKEIKKELIRTKCKHSSLYSIRHPLP